MLENLVFSLNVTIPIFLLMILGAFLKGIGFLKDEVSSGMNKFVFKVALPVLLFKDLSTQDFKEAFDLKFVLFCFLVTALSITSIFILSLLLIKKEQKNLRGEFIQAAYRSSAAILGIAFIKNIYGNSGMAPLMILASVPLYNIMAVIVLSVYAPGQTHTDYKKTLKGIVTNPIIIGIVIGFAWSLLKIPQPVILSKTVENIANTATPLGLIAMGASFDIKKAKNTGKLAIIAAVIKLVSLEVIFLPIAISLGFRESKLIAILVMLGSATTVSSFVMAKNMGHEGTLSASVVMLTTLFSAFTLTAWLYILKTMAYI